MNIMVNDDDNNHDETFTTQQAAWLAIVPKVSATLSMAGSVWILVQVGTTTRHNNKNKQQGVYHRLLAAMALYDIFESLWNFASTWPMPVDDSNVPFAMGNATSCTVQGFFLRLGLGACHVVCCVG